MSSITKNNVSCEYLFSKLPIGLITVDKDTNLIDANEFIFKYFNYGLSDVKGKRFGNVFQCSAVHGTDLKCGESEECNTCELRQGVLSVLQQDITIKDVPLSHDFQLNGRKTTKWFTVNASKVVKDGIEMALVAFTDITDLKETENELFLLGITDALTGLFNRRYILEKLDKLLKVQEKSDFPISIAMIDIDSFKKVNDTYGHSVGDDVLKMLSYILKKFTRNTDFVCRYGGEEFLVVFTNATSTIAKNVLDRVSEDFDKLKPKEIEQKLTFSGGLLTINEQDKVLNINQYIEKVDKLMYTAKENGRNRIVY